MKIFDISQSLSFIKSIDLPIIPRLKRYMYVTTLTEILVLVDRSQKVLYMYRVHLDPEFALIQDRYYVKIELEHRMRDIYFINEDDGFIFYYNECLVTALHHNNIESRVIYWRQVISTDKCYERGYIIHEGDHSKIILLNSNNNYVTELYIDVPFIPVFHAQIPLFYSKLSILRSFEGHQFAMPYKNGYVVILEDPQGYAILAKFEVTYSLQQALHFATYIESNDGSRIKTKQLIQSDYSYIFHFYKDADTFLIYTKEIVITISLRKNCQISILPLGIPRDDPYSLEIKLTKDPITNQEIEFLPFSLADSRTISLFLTVSQSGIVAQTVNPIEAIYVNQGNFRINFIELFSGNFLNYTMNCEPSIYCEDQNAPLYYTKPYRVIPIALSTALKLKLVFQWNKRIVSVDTNSNFRVYQQQENGIMVRQIDSNILQSIKNVQFAFAFHDPTFMDQKESIWIIQATDQDSKEIQMNMNLVVYKTEDDDFQFQKVSNTQANLPFKSAKYSQTWHSIFIIHETKGTSQSKLQSYTYDFAEQRFIPKRIVILDSYRMKVSPFIITAYQIHDSLPVIIIALKDYGVMAFNIFTSELVFALDFRRYFKDLGYIKFVQSKTLVISAILILNGNNIGFLITEIGIQLITFTYHFSLDTLVYPIFLIDNAMDKFSDYLYSPHTLPQYSYRAVNWVQIKYNDFYLHFQYQTQQIIDYFAKSFKACYLTHNLENLTWEIVIFNYFNNKYSKEYLRIPLENASMCYWIGADFDSFDSNDFISLFTFCLNPQNESFLYYVSMSLAPSAHFSVDRFKQYNSVRELRVNIQAKTYQSSISAQTTVMLKVIPNNESLYGSLTGIGIIVTLVLILYIIDCLIRIERFRSRRREEEEDLSQSYFKVVTVHKQNSFSQRGFHEIELEEFEINQ